MIIRIKTAEEFRASHVTIEVTPVGQAEIEDLEKALTLTTTSREFNRQKVLDQAAEIERLKADLARERAAHVCTSNCEPNHHVAIKGRRLVTELEAEVERLRAVKTDAVNSRDLALGELETTRKKLAESRDRINRLTDTSEYYVRTIDSLRADLVQERDRNAELGVELRSSDRLLQEAAHRLGEVRKIADRDGVSEALDFGVNWPNLAQALRDIRKVMLSSIPSSQA